MGAVAKMRQAGFELAITKRGGLWVEPASRLTDAQRHAVAERHEPALCVNLGDGVAAIDFPLARERPEVVVVAPQRNRLPFHAAAGLRGIDLQLGREALL